MLGALRPLVHNPLPHGPAMTEDDLFDIVLTVIAVSVLLLLMAGVL